MKGGERDMKKLVYVFVFVSLMVAVMFWATSCAGLSFPSSDLTHYPYQDLDEQAPDLQ